MAVGILEQHVGQEQVASDVQLVNWDRLRIYWSACTSNREIATTTTTDVSRELPLSEMQP